jgi:penicillin-insensitive murein endopeptidase
LCQAAGTDRAWLGKVRPYYGHYYHFHVRIKCPAGFAGCTPQVPPTGGDGCGKEVDQWLARVIPRKEPPAPTLPSAKPKPPKPPVMLSELPNECRAVLAAKPDPVAIPHAALMKPAEVRQVLAKAAAARATLAKAETASGDGHATGSATTGASGIATTSPALRPYMRKTIAAEKK